jgi:hypothetical protein
LPVQPGMVETNVTRIGYKQLRLATLTTSENFSRRRSTDQEPTIFVLTAFSEVRLDGPLLRLSVPARGVTIRPHRKNGHPQWVVLVIRPFLPRHIVPLANGETRRRKAGEGSERMHRRMHRRMHFGPHAREHLEGRARELLREAEALRPTRGKPAQGPQAPRRSTTTNGR